MDVNMMQNKKTSQSCADYLYLYIYTKKKVISFASFSHVLKVEIEFLSVFSIIGNNFTIEQSLLSSL